MMQAYLERFRCFAEFPSWLQHEVVQRAPLRNRFLGTFENLISIKEKKELSFDRFSWGDLHEELQYYEVLLVLHENMEKDHYNVDVFQYWVEKVLDDKEAFFDLPLELHCMDFYRCVFKRLPTVLPFLPAYAQNALVTSEHLLCEPSWVGFLHAPTFDAVTLVRKNPHVIRYLSLDMLEKLPLETWKNALKQDLSLLLYLPRTSSDEIVTLLFSLEGDVSMERFVFMFPPWLHLSNNSMDQLVFFVELGTWGYDDLDLTPLKHAPFYDLFSMLHHKVALFNAAMLNELLEKKKKTCHVHFFLPKEHIKKTENTNFKKTRLLGWKNTLPKKKAVMDDVLSSLKDIQL